MTVVKSDSNLADKLLSPLIKDDKSNNIKKGTAKFINKTYIYYYKSL